jgi:hypothetical protein
VTIAAPLATQVLSKRDPMSTRMVRCFPALAGYHPRTILSIASFSRVALPPSRDSISPMAAPAFALPDVAIGVFVENLNKLLITQLGKIFMHRRSPSNP